MKVWKFCSLSELSLTLQPDQSGIAHRQSFLAACRVAQAARCQSIHFAMQSLRCKQCSNLVFFELFRQSYLPLIMNHNFLYPTMQILVRIILHATCLRLNRVYLDLLSHILLVQMVVSWQPFPSHSYRKNRVRVQHNWILDF